MDIETLTPALISISDDRTLANDHGPTTFLLDIVQPQKALPETSPTGDKSRKHFTLTPQSATANPTILIQRMSKAEEVATGVDKQSVCGYCGDPASQTCTGCMNMTYCSKDHQSTDWQTHKLLCRSFATFQDRPEEGYVRAIVLPEDSKKPCFVWIPVFVEELESKGSDPADESLSSIKDGDADHDSMSIDSEQDERVEDMGWEEARANPTGYLDYEGIVIDSTDEESAMSSSTTATSIQDEEELGDSVQLRWRGTFNRDGSQPNTCVAYLTNVDVGTRFKGPLELYGVSSTTGSVVDLDTTFLTLAVKLLSDVIRWKDVSLAPEEDIGSGPTRLSEKTTVAVSDKHDVETGQ